MHLPGFVWSFLTHDKGSPRTFGVVADRRRSGRALHAAELRHLAVLANRHSGACAFGKIVILADEGIFTFQAQAAADAVPAFCGNSTAAAISCLVTDGDMSTHVHGASPQPYEVRAIIERDTILQRWTVPAAAVRERIWRGCRVLLLATLNNYALLLGPLPAGTNPEAARLAILGEGSGKLAVISAAPGPATVEFHNANGRHGAAPQTGLASIALAIRTAPWLGRYFPDGQLVYPTASGGRIVRLPEVEDVEGGRKAFAMPPTTVSLTPETFRMVA